MGGGGVWGEGEGGESEGVSLVLTTCVWPTLNAPSAFCLVVWTLGETGNTCILRR